MDVMSIRVILKSGAEFTVKCTEFALSKNKFEELAGYKIEGIEENKPLYIDWTHVAAVVRVMSDEGGDNNDNL